MAVTERRKAARTPSTTARGERENLPTVSAAESLRFQVSRLFISRHSEPPRDTTPLFQTHRTLALAPWISKRPRALVTTEAIVESSGEG